MEAKGTKQEGENNGGAKLTAKEVAEIRHIWDTHKHLPMRRRKELGVTTIALAEEYGVHKGTISRIVRSRNWIHV